MESGKFEIIGTVEEIHPAEEISTKTGTAFRELVLMNYITPLGHENKICVSVWNDKAGKLKIGDKLQARLSIQARPGNFFWMNNIILASYIKIN